MLLKPVATVASDVRLVLLALTASWSQPVIDGQVTVEGCPSDFLECGRFLDHTEAYVSVATR